MIFDSHSHYDDEAFDADRDELLKSLREKGVGKIISCASSWDSLKKVTDICHNYSFAFPALGIHPENAMDLTPERRPVLEALIEKEQPAAIGEIGLDYHYDEPPRDFQKDIFVYHLELAKRFNLPIIVHSRDAAEDTYELIKAHNPDKKGVIHCFSSSYEMAVKYVEMGYYIGIGGVVTFKNAAKLKDIATKIPLNSILLETDCPYMAPVPFRGTRNDSSLIKYVAEEIASLRGITPEEVIETTYNNTCRLFNV
ncbi:MAG: TatD family hydrolase [Lachnospiraceae bacterium]|nr:TatD family hydrolase [Lachnospiraceae bacterium]